MKPRAILVVALLAPVACGKSPRAGPAVEWHTLAEAEAIVKTEKRPIFVHHPRHPTAADHALDAVPVREALADYVAVRVTGDDARLLGVEPGGVVALGTLPGSPHAAHAVAPNELHRAAAPEATVLAAALRAAKERHATGVARAEARRARALALVPSPRIAWVKDRLDEPLERARREGRPVLIFVGAEWDKASKDLEVSFADPEVAMIVSSDFVAVSLDATDVDDPRVAAWWSRLRVKGTPTILTLSPDGAPLREWYASMPPDELAANLAD